MFLNAYVFVHSYQEDAVLVIHTSMSPIFVLEQVLDLDFKDPLSRNYGYNVDDILSHDFSLLLG